MEIVIKIPDEVLESRHYCQYFGAWSTKLTETIENGTPYNPSGDCISREALKETLRSYPQTDDMRTTELIGFFEKLIDNAQAIPQVTVFTESTDEKAVADLKAELENVIEARPQGDCISRSDLRKEVVGMMINKADDLEEVEFEINSALASVCEKIINAQAIPLPNEQIAWEQGYEAGLAQGKNDRPKGEWRDASEKNIFYEEVKCFECSICHKKKVMNVLIYEKLPFCPNCGADMKGGAK